MLVSVEWEVIESEIFDPDEYPVDRLSQQAEAGPEPAPLAHMDRRRPKAIHERPVWPVGGQGRSAESFSTDQSLPLGPVAT